MSICSKKIENWGRVDPQVPQLSDWIPATYGHSGPQKNRRVRKTRGYLLAGEVPHYRTGHEREQRIRSISPFIFQAYQS